LPELNGKAKPPLTRAELGSKYGASKADADAVVAALVPFGLTTVATNLATRTIRLSGPVSALESAFEVKLFNYAHESGAYRGRVGHVHVPVTVEKIVEGVFGLDNRRVARRRRQPARDNVPARAATARSIPSSWYTPAQLAEHYQFPPGDGDGETIGILEFGGGYFSDDLSTFCQLAGIGTPPTVKAVSTDGISTSAHDGAEGEVMLDIEVVAGVCPKASIVAYFAHFTEKGWIAALDGAVHDQENDPGVVSVSWGYAEKNYVWTRQAMKQVNEALLEPSPARVLHLLPSNPRAHHFFAAISFMTSISRSRSATSRFSRVFSASRAFRRFASGTSIAPNRLRQVYSVASLTPCRFATSGNGALSASRRIFTICSSVNLLLRIAPPSPEGMLSRFSWSENRQAGQVRVPLLALMKSEGCVPLWFESGPCRVWI
jgi:hypothetical protein